jgi:hypothetical protein
MAYFLPNEFMAPANQVVQEETSPDINEDEQLGGLMAQLVLAKQATFDKPARNRHMRPLYLKGYVNGKPLTKMFVDGGAAVNVMPYTTFRKLNMTFKPVKHDTKQVNPQHDTTCLKSHHQPQRD